MTDITQESLQKKKEAIDLLTSRHRLVCELQYAQRRFGIEGSKSPDPEFAALLQSYVRQLELVQQREDRVPEHIDALFQERYGFHYNKE